MFIAKVFAHLLDNSQGDLSIELFSCDQRRKVLTICNVQNSASLQRGEMKIFPIRHGESFRLQVVSPTIKSKILGKNK